jgi:stress-induced morphogen
MDPFLAELKARLQQSLAAVSVAIHDFSAEHAGHEHGGLNPHTSATHLEITVSSPRFHGLNRLQRERLVHSVLQSELHTGRVHALVLNLKDSTTEPLK